MKQRFIVSSLACAAAVLAASAAHSQDAPTLRPHGTDQPITRQEAPSDTSQETTADERAALGTTDDLPVALTRVAPVYPSAALAAHVQGTVLVSVRVHRDGSAEPPRLRRSVTGLDA